MLRSETAASPERRAAALAGLRAYQEAPRDRRRRPARVRYRQGRASLREYGGGSGRAVIFVPSLINPPFILDISPEISLMRWLADQGFRPFLLDWGTPGPEAREMDASAHVEQLLLPLLRRFREPPVLAGYCLGGTFVAAAAQVAEVAGAALIAAPWHFSGFGAAARADIAALWKSAKPMCEKLGLVPMEVLQAGFWRLDPGRTIGKYEAFAAMEPGSPAARTFVAMEDWANAGAPLPYAAGRQLMEDFIGADSPGEGKWIVKGQPIDPRTLPCPAVDFVSMSDRIVPAASAADLPDRRNLGAGHVGMIVGRGARSQLWEPLTDWLSGIAGTR
ncbi:alpha/beta fold hydrolase [soil metagenome]